MTMTADGLAKLHEEIGELLQETSKKLAYFYAVEHPDGAGPLNERMRREMADVYAALDFVCSEFGLDRRLLAERSAAKLALFRGSARVRMTAGGIGMLHQKMGNLLVLTGAMLDDFLDEACTRSDADMSRMTQAVADLYAALDYVKEKFELDGAWLDERRSSKLALFRQWQADMSNGRDSFHAPRVGVACS
jgi:hypothetical protein